VRELTAWAGGGTQLIAGTTLAGVALVVEHPGAAPHWMVFNLGDSRVYRWSGSGSGALERISVDHSVVQELLDAGLIDEDGARRHPERNVITRALGAADEVRAEAWLLPATEPQTFLICSDGLTKELDDARIAELLAPVDPAVGSDAEGPDAAVDRLLARHSRRAGPTTCRSYWCRRSTRAPSRTTRGWTSRPAKGGAPCCPRTGRHPPPRVISRQDRSQGR